MSKPKLVVIGLIFAAASIVMALRMHTSSTTLPVASSSSRLPRPLVITQEPDLPEKVSKRGPTKTALSALPSKAPNPRNSSGGSHLPAESFFLTEGFLSPGAINKALTNEEFEFIVRAMSRDEAINIDAREQTSIYRQSIEARLQKQQGGRLTDFSCGFSLCLGSIRSQSAARDKWSKAILEGSRLPVYAFTKKSYALSGGTTDHRFVFSVDPNTKAIRIPPRPKH